MFLRSVPVLLLILIVCLAALPAADAPQPGALGRLDRLTDDGLDKQRPAWAPEGRRLLFARHTSDGASIWQYVLDVDVPCSVPRRLTTRKDPEYHGAFAPDGKHIAFTAITLSGTQGNL